MGCLEGDEYVGESSVARNRKNLGGGDRMRREIAGEILRFLEGEKYLRESSVARNRKNLGGGRSDEAGDRGGDFAISGGGKGF